MIRGYLLYTPQQAERNSFLIQKYIDAAKRFGVCLELCVEADDPSLALADFVINRSRNHVAAKLLEKAGVYVSNSAVVCEVANDKLKTYNALSTSAPMLPTARADTIDPASLSYPVVVKPVDGHGGNGVTLIRSSTEFVDRLANADIARHAVQPLAAAGRDLRVYIVGNRPIACMQRVSLTDFRSNYSLGGSAYYVSPNDLSFSESAIINSICAVLPLDYAGVDIIYSGEGSEARPVLNEIEDPVGARMLYTHTELDAAYLHVEYILSKL